MINALCGTAPKRLKDEFLNHGIRLYETGPCNCLQEPLRGHIDLMALKWNEYLFVTPETEGLILTVLKDIYDEIPLKLIVTKEHLKETYPGDVLLNVKIVGKTVIGNRATMSETVREFFEERNFEFINIKQGYTGCSILKVNDDFIITDDDSIFEGTKKHIKTLKITKGSILLPGYNYGFIGGSTLALHNQIFLFGDYEKSPINGIASENECCKDNLFTSLLKDENLIDIGGIISLE